MPAGLDGTFARRSEARSIRRPPSDRVIHPRQSQDGQPIPFPLGFDCHRRRRKSLSS